MKYFILLLFILMFNSMLISCSNTVEEKTPVTTNPVVTPKPPTIINTDCMNYSWKGRGKPAIGYIKGISYSYQKLYCKNTPAKGPISSATNVSGNYKDALKHYNLPPGNELRKTFTMLIGLGMRESTGNYTLGRDYTAKGPQNSSQAETGIWQYSYDAIGSHPELRKIYEYYKKNPQECAADIYKEGLCDPSKGVCKNRTLSIRTDGYITSPQAGYEFQKFFRGCPMAQAEYAAVMIRFNSRHFGPLNRKEVEYLPICEKMFESLEKNANCG